MTRSEVKKIVIRELENCLRSSGLTFDTLADTTKLNADLSMTSMDFATLVADLEVAFSADPFMDRVSVTSVRTVGDLVQAYCLLYDQP